ncbi:hypothetical protein [Archaeoglobus veneficus]|uniref:Uncharacterized protein n=1 Tax=Archaeoglobus veneficus (strain DSM 11195 / SNP6) TaxID=693661 RepID=F2KPB2_ARCVS|nr:hypothetical protein [Archaeoglobus veneficus]AEA47516.1 hypothetical protein Arcve_1514 [Archaeoglobus veneficus SNP6]
MVEVDIEEIKRWLHLGHIDRIGAMRIIGTSDGYLGAMHPNISESRIVAVLSPNEFVYILREAIEGLKKKVEELEDEESKFEIWAKVKEFEKALEVTKEFIERYEQSKKKWDSSLAGKIFKKLGVE